MRKPVSACLNREPGLRTPCWAPASGGARAAATGPRCPAGSPRPQRQPGTGSGSGLACPASRSPNVFTRQRGRQFLDPPQLLAVAGGQFRARGPPPRCTFKWELTRRPQTLLPRLPPARTPGRPTCGGRGPTYPRPHPRSVPRPAACPHPHGRLGVSEPRSLAFSPPRLFFIGSAPRRPPETSVPLVRGRRTHRSLSLPPPLSPAGTEFRGGSRRPLSAAPRVPPAGWDPAGLTAPDQIRGRPQRLAREWTACPGKGPGADCEP